MKAISSRLASYLASRPAQVIVPDCFTVTLANGNQYHYTNADVPVTVRAEDDASGVPALGVPGSMVLGSPATGSSTVFLANSVRFDGLRYKIATGLEVDEQDVTISALPTETIEGEPFLQALAAGLFDGATLTRKRAFLPAWRAPAIGTVILFHGRFSAIEKLGRTQAQVKVKTDLVLLDTDMPRNLYQPGCWYTLYGYGCGLTKSAWGVTGAALAGSTTSLVFWSNPQVADTFNQGTVTFSSGVLAGVSATVKYSWSGGLALMAPLPSAPAAGDGFAAYPGCDHTNGSGGCLKFNNLANFPAFPFVPPPATAI